MGKTKQKSDLPKPKPNKTGPNGSVPAPPTGRHHDLPVDTGHEPLWMMGGLDEAPRWTINQTRRRSKWIEEGEDFEDDYNGFSSP